MLPAIYPLSDSSLHLYGVCITYIEPRAQASASWSFALGLKIEDFLKDREMGLWKAAPPGKEDRCADYLLHLYV